MSRLRKFDRNILWNSTIEDDEEPLGPLDTEEQEELIQKFELSNSTRNKRFINVLSLCYMLCSGTFLLLATKSSGKEMTLFVLCTQAVVFSMVNLRYELQNDFLLFYKLKLRFENATLQRLNIILIVLIEWIGLIHYNNKDVVKIFIQLPLVLFVIATLVKKWSRDMCNQLNLLRKMKYKYKNA